MTTLFRTFSEGGTCPLKYFSRCCDVADVQRSPLSAGPGLDPSCRHVVRAPSPSEETRSVPSRHVIRAPPPSEATQLVPSRHVVLAGASRSISSLSRC